MSSGYQAEVKYDISEPIFEYRLVTIANKKAKLAQPGDVVFGLATATKLTGQVGVKPLDDGIEILEGLGAIGESEFVYLAADGRISATDVGYAPLGISIAESKQTGETLRVLIKNDINQDQGIGTGVVVRGNVKEVAPGDDVQAAYDWLASADRDEEMGALSDTNPRILLFVPGEHDDIDLLLDTDFVYVNAGAPGTVLNGEIEKEEGVTTIMYLWELPSGELPGTLVLTNLE